MKQVIITGDDAGICRETNAAMEAAFRDGVLTSISVMANMPAFDDAVAMAARNPDLGTGLHLVLTSGRPVSPPQRVPLLVNERGMFRHGFLGLWRLLTGRHRRDAQDQVRREFAAQARRALDAGLPLDHVDGHRHVHMIPAVWPLVLTLARELGCAESVRVAAEPPDDSRLMPSINTGKAALLRWCARTNADTGDVQGAAGFRGILDAGRMTRDALAWWIRQTPDGISEIATHPSFAPQNRTVAASLCCAPEDVAFLRSPRRMAEADALLDAEVRRLVEELPVALTTFRSISAARRQAAGTATAC